MARLYHEGRGVPRDDVRAHAFLQLAARQDHPEARKQLVALQLSPDQITQAARLAQQWAATAEAN